MRNQNDKPIRVGAQAITWGDQIREKMPQILSFLHENGYAGAEIGVRHFDTAQPEKYRDLLRQSGIELVAIHSGGTFWNKAQAEAEMANIENAVQFAEALGCPFFALSGSNQETPETMKTTALAYNRIGRFCRERGLRLAYHNHNWEFAGQGELFEALLESTDPALVELVPDVAWIYRAGRDPAAVIEAHKKRVAYVHLKDTRDGEFCELGRGSVDLPGIVALLPRLAVEWVVVEQDTTKVTPEESLTASAAYLQTVGVM